MEKELLALVDIFEVEMRKMYGEEYGNLKFSFRSFTSWLRIREITNPEPSKED